MKKRKKQIRRAQKGTLPQAVLFFCHFNPSGFSCIKSRESARFPFCAETRDSRLPSSDFLQKTTESRECLSHAAEGVCFYCLCTADKRILQSRSLKTVLSKNVPPEREEVEQRLENRGNSAIPCIAKPLPALEFRFRLRRDPARKFRCGRRIFPLLMLPADLHFKKI